MKRVLGAVLVAAAVAALPGCSDSPGKNGDPAPKLGRLHVDVRRDGDKRAIRYAYVLRSVGRAANDTDYRLISEPSAAVPPEGIPPEQWGPINELSWDLPVGRYALDIYAVEACFRSLDIVVTEGKTTELRADLTSGGSVAGLVVGPSGDGMPGVLVFRPLDRGFGEDSPNWNPRQSTEASRVVRTGSSGKYYLPFLPPGDHVIVYYNEILGWVEKKVTVVDEKRLELKPIMIGKD